MLPASDPPEPVRRIRADALHRADEAWRLRVLGASWAEVAEAVGYANPENAIRAVRETFGIVPEPDRSEYRRLWRERLERLWRQAYSDALDRQPGAVTAAVRIVETAMRLDGLAAPSEVIVHNPPGAEIEAWVMGMMSERQPDLEEYDVLGEIEE
jgi:hypothetical protein